MTQMLSSKYAKHGQNSERQEKYLVISGLKTKEPVFLFCYQIDQDMYQKSLPEDFPAQKHWRSTKRSLDIGPVAYIEWVILSHSAFP